MLPSVAPPKCPVFSGNSLSFEDFKQRLNNNLIAEDESLNDSLKKQLLIDSLDEESKPIVEVMGDVSLKEMLDKYVY